MASRGVTIIASHGLQYEGRGHCHYALRPTQWMVDAQIYPGATARVWVVIPWEPISVPHAIIWEAGQALSPVKIGGFPGVASSGGERFRTPWDAMVRSVYSGV